VLRIWRWSLNTFFKLEIKNDRARLRERLGATFNKVNFLDYCCMLVALSWSIPFYPHDHHVTAYSKLGGATNPSVV